MNDLSSILHEAGAPAREAHRRLAPRLWDTDWLILRDLGRAVERVAAERARPETVAIDFGCGSRPYEAIFHARGVRYLGADFQGGDILIRPDGIVDAREGVADLVLSLQVLEHVRDLGVYFGEARRLLRPDGLMILSTHGNWLYHPHPEDHRRWTRQGLCAEIEAQGFELLQCQALVGPLAWTTMMRLTCFAATLRRVPLLGRFLAGAVAVLMNLRAALEERVTPGWVRDDNACVYLTVARRLP